MILGAFLRADLTLRPGPELTAEIPAKYRSGSQYSTRSCINRTPSSASQACRCYQHRILS